MKSHLIIQGPFFSDNKIHTKKSIISAIESGIFSKVTLSTYDHPELNDLRKSYLEQAEKGEYKFQPGIMYNDLFSSCEKVGDHIINVSEAVAGEI